MENIKYVIINIWKAFNNLIYSFMKLFKTKNKVTFISRQTNDNNIDFDLIIKELNKKENVPKIVVLNKKLEKGLASKISYMMHMYVQMYHIATSKVVIIDGYCIAISILKHKKELKVIQIWHALGCLKKFAYSILDKNEGSDSKIAKVMNMHKNYTYILASGEYCKEYFRQAFDAREDQMKVIPLPRVDFLKSDFYKKQTTDKFYSYYSEVKDEKKKILYVPTFRKNMDNLLEDIINNVNYEKYDLIIKTHDDTEQVYTSKDKFYSKNSKFTGMELLHIADYIITDYSAIVYEASVVNKPIYFYNYDYEEYIKNRGFYIDYEKEMPGLISKDIKVILDAIEKNDFDYKRLESFKEKYIDDFENNTKEIVKLID